MRSHLSQLAALFLLCSLTACQSLSPQAEAPPPDETPTPEKTVADLHTRNNAMALLDDLLNDEKNLSKVLIIKRNSDRLGKLVQDISKTAGDGATELELLAKNDPALNLKATDLPAGEAATRKAISKTKEHLLLHSKGAEFEFQLLLTQLEALNYGSHLAMVIAENEPQADRVQEFLRLAQQLRELNGRVLVMVRAHR
jgi:hypothetical protein